MSELLAAVNNIAIVADELQQFQGTWVCGAMMFSFVGTVLGGLWADD